MEKFKIHKETIEFYGKSKGSNANKWNRVSKLAKEYNNLHAKFLNMAERGKNSNTETYRCAVATLLLMETGIRIGNESSAEGYHTVPHPNAKEQESKFVQTYGLTTLLWEHVSWNFSISGSKTKSGTMRFNFLGKKQVDNEFIVPPVLAEYIIELHNHTQAGNDELVFGITDYTLTKFIKKYVGKQFSPKDFRTLRANIYAYDFLNEWETPQTKKDIKVITKEVCVNVSEKLNNTAGVCKKSYINAELFNYNLTF